MKKFIFLIPVFLIALGLCGQELNAERIQPFHENRMYWQYEGQPVLLLGGSNDDNLFQWTGKTLTEHLDLMVSVGGNYVRNVMSDRDEGNVFAFKKTKDGLYDLNTWNEEYWKRLEFFLEETAKRKIFVHLTLWDQYDLRAKGYEMKDTSPWNPKSNINYTESEFGQSWEDFFFTAEKGNKIVLQYQRRFVSRVLETSLKYGHVLYNICNENFTSFRWDNYWAQFIKETAEAKGGIKAQVTAMQMDAEATVRQVLGNPGLYTFADISQNNQDALGLSGTAHMDKVLRLRQFVAAAGEMPLNNVKIYGAENGTKEAGSGIEAVQRFWRDLFGGCASVRFHRNHHQNPSWGMGLTEDAQLTIQAARAFSQEFNVFNASPLPGLLSNVSANQAYCMGNPGVEYAVYLPKGGSVVFDPLIYTEEVEVSWFDVETGAPSGAEIHPVRWTGYARILKTQKTAGSILLTAPTTDAYHYRNQWIAIIKPKR
jgi:hypothetical protein